MRDDALSSVAQHGVAGVGAVEVWSLRHGGVSGAGVASRPDAAFVDCGGYGRPPADWSCLAAGIRRASLQSGELGNDPEVCIGCPTHHGKRLLGRVVKSKTLLELNILAGLPRQCVAGLNRSLRRTLHHRR